MYMGNEEGSPKQQQYNYQVVTQCKKGSTTPRKMGQSPPPAKPNTSAKPIKCTSRVKKVPALSAGGFMIAMGSFGVAYSIYTFVVRLQRARRA